MTTPVQQYGLDFEVPAGTLSTVPAVASFAMPNGAITRVKMTVPTGHNGLTGFALLLAGSPIVPYGGDDWVIASGETFTWDIQREVNDGQLTVQGYNTGFYPHTFHLLAEWVPTLGVQGATAVLATPTPDTTATDQSVAQLADFDTSDQADIDTDLETLDTSDLDTGESADTGELPAVSDLDDSEAPDQTVADVETTPAVLAPSETLTPLAPVPKPAAAKPKPKPKPKPPPKHAAPARKTEPKKK